MNTKETKLSPFLSGEVYHGVHEHPKQDVLAYYMDIRKEGGAFYMVTAPSIRMHLRACTLCAAKAKKILEAIPENIHATVIADLAYLEGLQRSTDV